MRFSCRTCVLLQTRLNFPENQLLVFAEKETFSDLDDDELDGFVLSTEEVELKEQVWTALNADYLERQAAKEAATCVADKVHPWFSWQSTNPKP